MIFSLNMSRHLIEGYKEKKEIKTEMKSKYEARNTSLIGKQAPNFTARSSKGQLAIAAYEGS